GEYRAKSPGGALVCERGVDRAPPSHRRAARDARSAVGVVFERNAAAALERNLPRERAERPDGGAADGEATQTEAAGGDGLRAGGDRSDPGAARRAADSVGSRPADDWRVSRDRLRGECRLGPARAASP